jgi:hypothetical protein
MDDTSRQAATHDPKKTDNGDSLTTLTTAQAARHLTASPRTLEAWRIRGGGPPYLRISSRCVRYRLRDLERWLDERTVRHTSEESA